MFTRSSCHIYKTIILLLLSLISSSTLYGQEVINGVINKYAKVNSIGAGYVVISDLGQVSQFSTGDYVLLIQMQGVGIQTVQGSYGINVQSVSGTPGGYELLIVQSVNYGTGRVDFTRNVYINNYDVAGNVQLIQVPFYNSPVVNGTLTSQVWNSVSGTGGVLALMAGRKLTLNADIDVTGQGFSGAAGVSGIGECVRTNEAANNHDSYPETWGNAGLKGEGVAIHDFSGALLYPNHAKGQGRNFSGGGGGNGMYSGGGGGSNRGRGGDGGLEISSLCAGDPRDGGFGGISLIGSPIQNDVLLGGGGGASTQAAGATASSGGNGGGIVIIIADTIDGNNQVIRSNGTTAANAVGNAGAGGGGAGGSVALSFQGFTSQLQLASNGGNGGTNPGGFGQGGGGGGGLLWLSSSSIPANITSALVAYGIPAPTTPSEGNGEIKYNFFPKLNGFLFNSICSKVTGNQIDSVCSNILYGQIKGTQPVGGTPPYTFLWESSTVSATAGFASATGTNNQQHYTPPALLAQTTWFRRRVTDSSTPSTIIDISLPVRIIVHSNIKNNVIGNSDTLCYGQNASALNSLLTLQDGNGIYTFAWESSTDNVSFSNASGNSESYLPPAGLTQTTWYRRTVISGSCVDVSPSLRINVLPVISNNSILSLPEEICQGMTFTNLAGTISPALSGGDNTYRYRWESSSDGSTWTTALGTNNGASYDPSESASYFPGQEYFRRVVLSGSNNVCVNGSNPVILSAYPVITNNLITSGDQTVCSGASPAQLTGTTPLNGKGAGSYTFTWQDSTKSHTWTNIAGYTGVTSQNFIPPALTDTTRYRRITNSSACIDIGKSVIVNVHKPINNNTVSLLAGGLTDTTICNGAVPHMFIGTNATGGTNLPGDYAYQWSSSPDNSTWADVTASATGLNYQPPSLTATTYFRRRAISGQCFSESGAVKVTVLPLITNNTISSNQTVCKSDTPELLGQASGASLAGGGGSGTYSFFWEQSLDGTVWNPATGINNLSNGSYQPPVMTREMKYRRTVKSGANDCCINVSNILELVPDSLPAGSAINAGPDTTIYSFDHMVQMIADPAIPGGTGKWTVVFGSGSFENDSDNDTRVSGLLKGLNSYLWTVTKGACKLEDQVDVTIVDLVIPEGFSPNDDPSGYNNEFIIKGLDLPNQTAELIIINGAGTEVFSTSNRNGNEWTDWDGKNSKGVDLPEGTYYYLLKLTSNWNGQVFKKSGFIILKRY
jgi:hypothetical protein